MQREDLRVQDLLRSDSRYIEAAEMLLTGRYTIVQIWQHCLPERSLMVFAFKFNHYYSHKYLLRELFNRALTDEQQKRG